MQGLGNDFVVIDGVNQSLSLTSGLIKHISDRHYGIGCDQVLVVGKPANNQADFTYQIFNADGSEVAQCGNGARCVGLFIMQKGLSKKQNLRLATKARLLDVSILENGLVQVDMGRPDFEPTQLPMLLSTVEQQGKLRYTIDIAGEQFDYGLVNVGNPHVVTIVDHFDLSKIVEVGTFCNEHKAFPEGVNVGFMKINAPDNIELRVFERGVGPTEACGSGACAAVVIGRSQGVLASSVIVRQPGGDLRVDWLSEEVPILMSGPASFVFEGEWLENN